MEKAKKLIEELKGLIGKTDEQSMARQDEISFWFRDHQTPENVKLMQQFLQEGYDGILEEAESIRRQIDTEDYKLLPLSYIAEHYFGKTRSWLYQRINGTPVRGKVYSLNTEQRAVFNNAVQDLSRRIGSICI